MIIVILVRFFCMWCTVQSPFFEKNSYQVFNNILSGEIKFSPHISTDLKSLIKEVKSSSFKASSSLTFADWTHISLLN